VPLARGKSQERRTREKGQKNPTYGPRKKGVAARKGKGTDIKKRKVLLLTRKGENRTLLERGGDKKSKGEGKRVEGRKNDNILKRLRKPRGDGKERRGKKRCVREFRPSD